MTHVSPTPLANTGSQFSLQQAFVLLTILSVVFAALAIRMQWLTSAAKLQMTLALLVALGVAMLGYALTSLSNARGRKSAGTLIATTQTPIIRWPILWLFWGCQIINGLMAILMCDPDFASGLSGLKWFNIVFFSFITGGSLLNLRASRSACLTVTENGIYGHSFIPWKFFRKYAWGASDTINQLTLTPRHSLFVVRLEIDYEDREAVQKVLDDAGLTNSSANSRI